MGTLGCEILKLARLLACCLMFTVSEAAKRMTLAKCKQVQAWTSRWEENDRRRHVGIRPKAQAIAFVHRAPLSLSCFLLTPSLATMSDSLVLRSATTGSAAAPRPRLPPTDALPYYDREIDEVPGLRTRVEREVAAEMARAGATTQANARVPDSDARLPPVPQLLKVSGGRRAKPPSPRCAQLQTDSPSSLPAR